MLRKFSKVFIFKHLVFCRYLCDMSDLKLEQAPKIKRDREKNFYKQYLVSQLGLSNHSASTIVRDYPRIINGDINELAGTINVLKKFHIRTDDAYRHPETFTIRSRQLENYILYLKEVGFEDVSLDVLVRFRQIIRKPIYMFKDYGIIPENVNVSERLISYLKPAPEMIPALNTFTDRDSIADVHDTIFHHYLAWRLNVPLSKIESTFAAYENFKFKNFESLSKLLKYFLVDFGFSSKKMISNAYLCPVYPESIENMMNAHPTLAGVDIRDVFSRHPKLIIMPIQNFTEILKHLKEFDIPDESIRKCFDIFTLAPETVLRRLKDIKTVPEFKVLLRNPRIVRLVLNYNKAKSRLEQLKKLKVKCASIHVLCGADNIFERYIHEGNGKTRGFDVTKSLAQEFHTTQKHIREKLSVNPNWCHVPLTTVQDSLKYLLGRGFTKEDIGCMPVLLLYPREKLEEAFEESARSTETDTNELSPKKQLNLCLYFIEKKHHFSGDGIWQNCT